MGILTVTKSVSLKIIMWKSWLVLNIMLMKNWNPANTPTKLNLWNLQFSNFFEELLFAKKMDDEAETYKLWRIRKTVMALCHDRGYLVICLDFFV